LDVHPWSAMGHAFVGLTGWVWQRKLAADPTGILTWFRAARSGQGVVYEAGPTGYSLYAHLTGHEVRYFVAAPSKLHRPWGDWTKTGCR
jgi:transposase